MVEGVFSFHTMRQACLEGQPAAWRHFVKLYGPVSRRLLRHYFPEQGQEELLAGVFRDAMAEKGRIWRSFSGTGEKEFLFHWRMFLFSRARAARPTAPPTPLTPENFWSLLESFPPLQRELLLLAYRRYGPEELAELTRFTAESAQKIIAEARSRWKEKVGEAPGPEPERQDHDALFAAIEERKGEKCYPDRLFVRIADGQVTWREREDAEFHIESCLNCLYRSTAFRDVALYFHKLPPGESAEFSAVFRALALPEEEQAAKKPWWRRLAGG